MIYFSNMYYGVYYCVIKFQLKTPRMHGQIKKQITYFNLLNQSTPSVPKYRSFCLFQIHIVFAMHLDITYVQIYSKIYEFRKVKTTYILEQREYPNLKDGNGQEKPTYPQIANTTGADLDLNLYPRVQARVEH